MKITSFLTLILTLFLFIHCEKEDAQPELAPVSTGTLKVEVTVCFPQQNPLCDNRKPVSNASIFLYETEEARKNEEPVFAKRITGDNGIATFGSIDPGVYYVSTVSNFGKKETRATVQVRATKEHLVDYYAY